MAVPQRIPEPFPFGGIDERGLEHTRPPIVAIDSLNMDYFDSGDEATSRLGSKVVEDNTGAVGGFGTFVFNKNDGTSELLKCGSKLYRQLSGSISVTYSGSGSSIVISVLLDETSKTWKCQIDVDGTNVLDYDLKVGFDEASTVTVDDLRSQINGLTDFSASISGSTSAPAAFIFPFLREQFSSNSYSIPFKYNEQVNQPTGSTDPFAGSNTNKNDSDFENISSIEYSGVRYFANQYDEMKKYDGSDIYRAGLPKAEVLSAADTGSGSNPATGTYLYQTTYEQKDAAGNITEGIESDSFSHTVSSAGTVDLDIKNIQPSSGFNTDGARADGAQSTVTTINVDDGAGGAHSLKVGQTAFFYDSITGDNVERKITAVTSSTITIEGAAVTIADNAKISNNLRIKIWRTPVGGSVFGLIATIANDSYNSMQPYSDSTASGSEGAQFTSPSVFAAEHALPPKFRYLTLQGRMAIGARGASDGTSQYVYFSDIDSPEYWPSINNFRARGPNSTLTGIVENNDALWIFRKNALTELIGDLQTGQWDSFVRANRAGCAAHATIRRYENSIVWASEQSVYISQNGGLPQDLGAELFRIIDKQRKADSRKPVMKRAVAIDDPITRKYLLFVPTESTTSSNVHANGDSFVLAYDFSLNRWLKWGGLNMAGGVARDGEDLYWTERRYSTYDSAMSYLVWQRLRTGEASDFIDHNSPIEGLYKPGWFHGGSPLVHKAFHRLAIMTNHPTLTSQFDLSVDIELDFVPGRKYTQKTLSFGLGNSQGFGLGAFGVAPFGAPSGDQIREINLLGQMSRAMRPVFSWSVLKKRPVLAAWSVETALNTREGMQGYV